MAKTRKSKGKFQLDLHKIDDYAYTLQEAPEKVRSELDKILNRWSAEVENSYASKISYARGFKSKKAFANTNTFHEVDSNKLKASVGHTAFVAKFVEVGTRSHSIERKTKNGRSITQVRGQTGTKALSKAFSNNATKLDNMVSDAIQNILTDI